MSTYSADSFNYPPLVTANFPFPLRIIKADSSLDYPSLVTADTRVIPPRPPVVYPSESYDYPELMTVNTRVTPLRPIVIYPSESYDYPELTTVDFPFPVRIRVCEVLDSGSGSGGVSSDEFPTVYGYG